MDNSGKENKNHTVFAYCQALVDSKRFETIIMKYMVPGHTQFLPDLVLGNLRNYGASQSFFSLKEVADVIDATAKDVEVAVLHPASQYDYASWCAHWAVIQTNYAVQKAFIRSQLRFAQFGFTQKGIMLWSTTSTDGRVLQRYPMIKPGGGVEHALELIPWSPDSAPEDKLQSLREQMKFVPAGRLTLPGTAASLEAAQAVTVQPLLLDVSAKQAGIDKRESRRRALVSAEHTWSGVLGAKDDGDSVGYLVGWRGEDWKDVYTWEAWDGVDDPDHTVSGLELEQNICGTNIALLLDGVWKHGVIRTFDSTIGAHTVAVGNGPTMNVQLPCGDPSWRLADLISVETWACYAPADVPIVSS